MGRISPAPRRPHAAIARAKREWESIADAIPQLLCLLGHRGEVLRINRVVEHWGIGAIRDVLGKDLHTVIHPQCSAQFCSLRTNLDAGWQALLSQGNDGFEVAGFTPGRVVRVDLKRLANSVPRQGADGDYFAVCMFTDITQLKQAQDGQLRTNQELETRVQARTRELSAAVKGLRAEVVRRELAETSLRESRNELSLLSERLMKAQEGERKRIAQDLHDAVGQSLSAIKYSLERAVLMLMQPHLGSPVKVINKTVEHVQHTIDEVRSISENLRPALLDGLGAVSAIRWLCREWSEVFSDIEVEINLHITDADVSEPLGTMLFRTVQESLNNVARHSRASRVVISIGKEADSLRMDISDDGVGFEPDSQALRRGYGLAGIRERVTNTGGRFLLSAYPGGGTQLTLFWQLGASSRSGAMALCAS